jgi:hypothetical protein
MSRANRPRASSIALLRGRICLFRCFCIEKTDDDCVAWKGLLMSGNKSKNEANITFRPSDTPLTEYEAEQKALRKNLERLRAERLAREAAKPKED